jgi:UDP-N-acetylglucosamine--N-acetylmuramyl-(pentapeptide) pyrophosphoryl-undecaprenol N-acetylglucosamine transferase
VGVGSVLVPFPQAVDDHQTRNAEFLVERGAAVLLPQDDQLADRLQTVLGELRADAGKRIAMAEAARTLAKPDAAARVADIVLDVIRLRDAQRKEAA